MYVYKVGMYYKFLTLKEFFVAYGWAEDYAEVEMYVRTNLVKCNGIIVSDANMLIHHFDFIEFGEGRKAQFD